MQPGEPPGPWNEGVRVRAEQWADAEHVDEEPARDEDPHDLGFGPSGHDTVDEEYEPEQRILRERQLRELDDAAMTAAPTP